MVHVGVVSAFDEARGLGTVTGGVRDEENEGAVDGDGRTWTFHCTAIADGSRTIEVGARVAFDVVPGHLGRMEATRVTKLDGPAGTP